MRTLFRLGNRIKAFELQKKKAREFCSLAFRHLLHKPNRDGEPAGEEVGFCVTLCCLVLTKKMQTPTRILRPLSDSNPAKRIGAEGEKIPARVQFSAKPERER